MPPVESTAYGSRSLNSSVQKRVVRTRTESLTCIRGGGRSMRSKDIALCASLRISRSCMHSTTPRLWAVPPWHCHHAPSKDTKPIASIVCHYVVHVFACSYAQRTASGAHRHRPDTFMLFCSRSKRNDASGDKRSLSF